MAMQEDHPVLRVHKQKNLGAMCENVGKCSTVSLLSSKKTRKEKHTGIKQYKENFNNW